jgi:translation initiation factor 1
MGKSKKTPLASSPSTWNNPFDALAGDSLPAGPTGAHADTDAAASISSNPKLGRVVLRREKAHRGGKTVIVVHDFEPQITDAMIEDFASQLRKACGCGGTVKDRTIELQGDQPARIRTVLGTAGFRVAGIS